MEEQLISFTTAKLAKEKGFKTNLLWYHDNDTPVRFPYYVDFQTGGNEDNRIQKFIKDGMDRDGFSYDYSPISDAIYYHAPTQALLQKWLREKGLIVTLEANYKNVIHDSVIITWICTTKEYNTYEEALEEGLVEMLKLIK